MCSTVKTPKPQPVEKKDPVYMRNPWLDGLGIGAESSGRNSLRINMGTPVARPRTPSTTGRSPQPNTPTPAIFPTIGGATNTSGTDSRTLAIRRYTP